MSARMIVESRCQRCEADIIGPPVVDWDELFWTGSSSEWCSTDCRDMEAESRDQSGLADYYGGSSEVDVREMLKHAGRL